MAALPPVAYRRAAARRSAAGTPVISSVASGLYSGEEMKEAQVAKSSGSQRSATNSWSTRSSVTTTWARALTTATLVPGHELQMVVGLDVGRADDLGAARVDHDELGALAEPALHPGGEDGVRLGRVRPDHDDDVAAVDRLEVLRAGRGAEGLLQAETGGGVADPSAGVDVVVAEGGPDHLLDDEDLFVGATRGGDPADSADAVASLDRLCRRSAA